MGGSSSKVTRSAGSAARKYPTRAPGSAVPSTPSRSKAAPAAAKPKAQKLGDGVKDDSIRADSMDPDFVTGDFSRRLHQMGIAEPNTEYNASSTAAPQFNPQFNPQAISAPSFPPSRFNPTLTALEARTRLQQQATDDFEGSGRADVQGRRFLNIRAIADAVQLRDQGVPQRDIEARLRIQPGLLDRLGRKEVLSHINSP